MQLAPKLPRLNDYLQRSALLLLTVALTVHFVLLWFWNAPSNVIKTRLTPVLSTYVAPLLYQNWSFFAPQPVDRDMTLLARAQTSNGVITPWFDVLGYFVAGLRQNRLSHREMTITSISNAILDTNQIMAQLHSRAGDLNYYDFPNPRILYRVGADAVQSRYRHEVFNAVQIAIVAREFPRFAKRRDDAGRSPTKIASLPWHAFPETVSLP